METYHILINGHFDDNWADWFDSVNIIPQENGKTLIIYSNADQAALHGILKRIYNLGIPLVSLEQVISDENETEINNEK